MMASRFLDARSVSKLQGVDPALVQLVYEAFSISDVPFIVTDGLRSSERQAYLFASGKTKTLRSRHLDGKAVDVAALIDGRVNWEFSNYEPIAAAFRDAAARLGLSVVWGGDWPKFRDGCHFQLA